MVMVMEMDIGVQSKTPNHTLTVLSETCGWIYFVVWSISFYGQTYTNWKLKSVEGMKLDYIAYNLTGYLFYGISNTFGYFGNPAKTGLSNVDLQDLLFTYHGELLTFVKVFQCFIYPKGKNTLSVFCMVMQSIFWTFIVTYAFLTNVFNVFTPALDWNTLHWLGYIKLMITLIKYVPQVYWNYQRKSTKGWSIFNVICDIIGGGFSILQDILDTVNGDTSVFGGLNTIKFLLGCITIFFDVIFIVQHYCIYPQNNSNNGSKRNVNETESNLSDKIAYEQMENEHENHNQIFNVEQNNENDDYIKRAINNQTSSESTNGQNGGRSSKSKN